MQPGNRPFHAVLGRDHLSQIPSRLSFLVVRAARPSIWPLITRIPLPQRQIYPKHPSQHLAYNQAPRNRLLWRGELGAFGQEISTLTPSPSQRVSPSFFEVSMLLAPLHKSTDTSPAPTSEANYSFHIHGVSKFVLVQRVAQCGEKGEFFRAYRLAKRLRIKTFGAPVISRKVLILSKFIHEVRWGALF